MQLRAHGFGHIEAVNEALLTDEQRRNQRVSPGAATDVEDCVTCPDKVRCERITDACKRLDGCGWNPIEQVSRITDEETRQTAGRKMKSAAWLRRHVRIHLLDGLENELTCATQDRHHGALLLRR